jgi:sulfopyruvate decarboxylase subunit alpha
VTSVEQGLSAERVVATLKQIGITHVVWLPDSVATFMYQALAAEPDLTLIPVCREAETMAIALGLMMGGKEPICLIQNTGFMESGDSIRGLVLEAKAPMLLMIGYKGWRFGQPMTDSSGVYLEPLLNAWGIRYYIVDSDADVDMIAEAYAEAKRNEKPVAVLIGKDWQR